jgi:hypothetical protein
LGKSSTNCTTRGILYADNRSRDQVVRWYQPGIIRVMGMTLRPSEQQAEALRLQAASEGRSMQAVALSAIEEYIARRTHKAKVGEALQRVLREEAGVLERLKDA